MLIICDANCWIDASRDPTSDSGRLLVLAGDCGARVAISKHSFDELASGTAKYGADAENLARGYFELPYYPIGVIGELLGSIDKLAGTIAEMGQNDALREKLGILARQGSDIRDRGALIDAAPKQTIS